MKLSIDQSLKNQALSFGDFSMEVLIESPMNDEQRALHYHVVSTAEDYLFAIAQAEADFAEAKGKWRVVGGDWLTRNDAQNARDSAKYAQKKVTEYERWFRLALNLRDNPKPDTIFASKPSTIPGIALLRAAIYADGDPNYCPPLRLWRDPMDSETRRRVLLVCKHHPIAAAYEHARRVEHSSGEDAIEAEAARGIMQFLETGGDAGAAEQMLEAARAAASRRRLDRLHAVDRILSLLR